MLPTVLVFTTLLASVFTEISFLNVEVKGYTLGVEKFKRRLKNAKSISEYLPELEVDKISIVGQNVGVLYEQSLSNLDALDELVIEESNVREIKAGAIRNVPNLRVVSFKKNKLDEIKSGVFNNLTISTLDLSENQISKIDGDAFDNMEELLVINLGYNMIRKINNDWFKNTPNLMYIKLYRNHIEEIPTSAFKNLGGNKQADYLNTSLSITLDHNNIKKIHPGAFKELSRLDSLWLHDNILNHIDENTFHPLQIKKLTLENNGIQCLEGDLDKILPAEEVKIDPNPLICKCMRRIKAWAEERKMKMDFFWIESDCILKDIDSRVRRLESLKF
ncbi:leucine-rich repeat-containing protein 15-like [Aethina tumida]|uniref:leucine-rich repeat-containing protein 15-like n=1 Tax=Aethina tumida TaxID=116153 RepID=UPI0021472BE8|nr:leucine-rich repeat-containing protein 15-like [Aethina tumida]